MTRGKYITVSTVEGKWHCPAELLSLEISRVLSGGTDTQSRQEVDVHGMMLILFVYLYKLSCVIVVLDLSDIRLSSKSYVQYQYH